MGPGRNRSPHKDAAPASRPRPESDHRSTVDEGPPRSQWLEQRCSPETDEPLGGRPLQASLFLESTSGGKLPEDIGLHVRGTTTPRDGSASGSRSEPCRTASVTPAHRKRWTHTAGLRGSAQPPGEGSVGISRSETVTGITVTTSPTGRSKVSMRSCCRGSKGGASDGPVSVTLTWSLRTSTALI